MAFAGIMGHVGRVDVTGGLITVLLVWVGFVLSTKLVDHQFGGVKLGQTAVEAGFWLAALLIQDAVIGAIGVWP